MKVKVIKLENSTRIIQGSATDYLDLDFSLPLSDLKPILIIAITALIESNPHFMVWQTKNWSLSEGVHYIKFIEDDRTEDPNVLLISFI